MRKAQVLVVVTTINDCIIKDSGWSCTAKQIKNHVLQTKIILEEIENDNPEIAVAVIFRTAVEIISDMLSKVRNPTVDEKIDDHHLVLKVTNGDHIIYLKYGF